MTHGVAQQAGRTGERDQRRHRRARRLADRRVRQHDAGQLVAVRRAPSRARSAPPQSWATVTTGPVDAERLGHRTQVVRRGRRAGARAPVRSEQPMPRWSTATTRQSGGRRGEQAAPQVRPGRVAVHAQRRSRAARRPSRARPRCRARARCAVAVRVGGASTIRDQRRVEAGQPRRRPRGGARPGPPAHQRISLNEVFRPEPMPMHSTRSPGCSDSACARQGDRHRRRSDVAEQSGRSAARVPGRCPSRAHSELVCTDDTWWMT